MLDIQILENSGYFKQITLEPSEILFDEGDIDNNIYIVKSGEISVEKQLTGEENNIKILASLKQGKIFGEGALNDSDPKQVRIKANTKTELLSIDAQKGIEKLLTEKPTEGLSLLKHIIYLGNKRVLKSNAQITSTYEINNSILHLEKIDNRSIFGLIDTFKNITNVDYVIYLEKNTVLDGYYNLKYDTRYKGKLLDSTLEIQNEENIESVIKSENVQLSDYNLLEKLHVGNYNIGYFIIGKKTEFEENDKKIIISIGSSLSGVMRQKRLLDEERDKNYMNN